MDNKLKGYYLLKKLPEDTLKEVLFRLPLDIEKKYYKVKINIKKDKEINVLREIILNILDNIKGYKDNFVLDIYFLFFYIFIALVSIIILIITNYNDSLEIIKRLVNSGTGHLFMLVIIIWHINKILRIKIIEELSVKKLKPVEIFYLVFSIIILSGLLFFGNLKTNRTILEPADDYLSLSIILFPTVVPVLEELIFRRYIYRYLREHLDPVTAMFITAILFVAVHDMFNLILVLIVLVSSLILSIIYETSGKLLFPIIVHGLSNLSIILLVYI